VSDQPPVVFIHGLWLHSTSWNPWAESFREKGFPVLAPEWPGVPDSIDAARKSPDGQAGKGITDVVDHYAGILRSLDRKPIVIGHSFGGLIAQKLLGQDLAAAAVAIDPAPIKGVLVLPPAQLKAAFPVFRNPANRKRTVSLTPEQFRYAFGNAVPEQESNELHAAWTIPAPGRPLFEAAFANFSRHSPAAVDTANTVRGPLLLISGGADHTVPDSVTRATFKRYKDSSAVTELRQFPDRGHSLTIDHGWPEIADAALTWLQARREAGSWT
jgi:pimeloyl-ACP methyl ester carboxylesterase